MPELSDASTSAEAGGGGAMNGEGGNGCHARLAMEAQADLPLLLSQTPPASASMEAEVAGNEG